MKQASYVDAQGRKWATWIEDDMADSEACMGIPIGPPSLEVLNLPLAVEVRLHNELFERGILTEREANRRPQELFAALQAAYRLDVAALLSAFA